MSAERKRVEVWVGLFLLAGFTTLAIMVVLFGKVGTGMKRFYELSVEFPNAGGLSKGSDIMLAGARIGNVAAPPQLDPKTYHVVAKLRINEEIRIPRQARVSIGSSGLLGDKYVEVHLPAIYDSADMLNPGERVGGSKAGGLAELTDKGGELMDRVVGELEHIESLTVRLNEGLLHERNLKNIEQSFENLKTTTERFKAASQDLEVVVQKAGALVDATQGTIKTADGAAADLRVTIGDLRKMIAQATKAVDTTNGLMRKASEGDGALGTLVSDKKMAEDLRALVANLRHSGVLFYKDRAALGSSPAPRR